MTDEPPRPPLHDQRIVDLCRQDQQYILQARQKDSAMPLHQLVQGRSLPRLAHWQSPGAMAESSPSPITFATVLAILDEPILTCNSKPGIDPTDLLV